MLDLLDSSCLTRHLLVCTSLDQGLTATVPVIQVDLRETWVVVEVQNRSARMEVQGRMMEAVEVEQQERHGRMRCGRLVLLGRVRRHLSVPLVPVELVQLEASAEC